MSEENPLLLRDPLAGGLLLKMLKFSHVKEIVESWLGYVNKFS